MTTVGAVDEGWHEPGRGASWCESWWFEAARDDGCGFAVRVQLFPHDRRVWYWAHVVDPDGDLVAVRDHDEPFPPPGRLLLRGVPFWAELVCEEPLKFWTIGLETYGVLLDSPSAAYGDEYGERIPIAFDLEWESYTPPTPLHGGLTGYEHAGTVHGEIHLGSTTIGFGGRGARGHSWGDGPWWAHRRHRAAFQLGDALAVGLVADPRGRGAEGYVWRVGEGAAPVESLRVETHLGPGGFPVAARYVVNHDLELEVEVTGFAPVALGDEGAGLPAGRLPRALCRATAGGDSGLGWAEWFQPRPL